MEVHLAIQASLQALHLNPKKQIIHEIYTMFKKHLFGRADCTFIKISVNSFCLDKKAILDRTLIK